MVAQHHRESELIISTVIGDDHKLVIDLPSDTPTGPVEIRLVVSPMETPSSEVEGLTQWQLEYQRLRAKRATAGKLSLVQHDLPDEFATLSDDELLHLEDEWLPVEMLPGSPPSEQIVNVDQGAY